MGKKPLSHISSLQIASWISGMLLVILMKQVTSQSGDRSDNLLRKCCRSFKAMNGEIYIKNLNTVFSSLQLQLSDPQVYYAFAQAMDNDEYVYSFALCREYLSTSQCLACFDSAVIETKACGSGDGGNVVYDDCSIRYENYVLIFGDKGVILDTDAPPYGVCSNESASQPITTFNKIVENLISDIVVATPRTSNFYVASSSQVTTNSATVYAVAQCAKNTSQAICRNCLNTAYNNLQGCLPSSEGRAIDFLSFMRYSKTQFFQSNQTTNIIPFISKESSSKSGMIVGISSGVGLVLLILVLWLWYRHLKKVNTVKKESGLQGGKCYGYQDLRLATHNFGEEYRIGKGGFGEVFKAIIEGGNIVVVKRLNVCYRRDKIDFENEVTLISNVQHRNLIRLLGSSTDRPELLVLEYMPQGSLDKFLWGEKKGTHNWKKRYDIILGVARGLAHLHNEFHVKIVHRNIKSNNLLLDDDFQLKITDFGLARLQPDDITHVSTRLAGMLGYLAPKYETK